MSHTHEHKSLEEEIKDIMAVRLDPNFQTYSAVKRFGLIMIEVLEAGCELAHNLRDPEELIPTLEKLFQEYVVPIDLPMNDFLEVSAETALRQLIRPTITAVYKKAQAQLESPK